MSNRLPSACFLFAFHLSIATQITEVVFEFCCAHIFLCQGKAVGYFFCSGGGKEIDGFESP